VSKAIKDFRALSPADRCSVCVLVAAGLGLIAAAERDLISGASLLRIGSYAGEVLGVPGARLESLLDPAPLRDALRERVDFDQLERNVKAGRVDVAGVCPPQR
jgi:hypothetical protein